ncbi:hypothetical protein C2G38_2123396 [Gigaspora rosea]|uniref:Uncharacterized protein n=1 Tax=Gigaspora rosea TaxID=44941 RepID=A0A397U3D8_9GLOM|nr:hypothetical protein C2G38_2123396 [Gigaspora rosea]
MSILGFISALFRKTFHIIALLTLAINRWLAFTAHLIMMFFIWNSLLVVIGCVNTVQMIIGFGFDFMKVASGRSSLPPSNGGEKRSALNEYWYNRRKGYQEMIDKLYVNYMERLHGVQQQQQQYWQWQQQQRYYYPQGNISEYDESALAHNYGSYDINTQ